MKKFKEYLGEAFFKVKIPDVAPTFVEAGSASQVKASMRKIMKPDVVKELEIERVTPAKMKQMYRDMAKGKDEVEEGILDLLTKKGRDKQAKVKKRLAGVRKTRDQDEKDWEAWRRASSKSSGGGGTQADYDKQKELEKKPYVRDRIKKYREKERERTKSR